MSDIQPGTPYPIQQGTPYPAQKGSNTIYIGIIIFLCCVLYYVCSSVCALLFMQVTKNPSSDQNQPPVPAPAPQSPPEGFRSNLNNRPVIRKPLSTCVRCARCPLL